MSQVFKINREELLIFAKQLYEEACCGYMDLRDSISESMLQKFLEKHDPVLPFPSSNTVPMASSGIQMTTSSGSYVGGYDYVAGIPDDTPSSGIRIQSTTGSLIFEEGPPVGGVSGQIAWTDTPLVRAETLVREGYF